MECFTFNNRMDMRIVKFEAENVKKLKVVEIVPGDSPVVQITGPNGAGKSSVLDAIYMALAGAKAIPGKPVRKGQETAKVTLDLGEIVVTRKFTADGKSSLTVAAGDGARYQSPQSMLDAMLGSLAFDPLAFSRKEPKDQLLALRSLVTLDVDIDALDAQNAADYARRTDLNRQARELETRAEGIVVPGELPEQPVDVGELLTAVQSATQMNADLEKRKANREALAQKVWEKRDQAMKLRAQADMLEAESKADQAKLDGAAPLPEPIDVSDLTNRIAGAQDINRAIENRKAKQSLLSQHVAAKNEAIRLTMVMEDRARAKFAAISRATMPVEGLSFGDDEVLYNGIPFAQASSAEQLRVSVAIAMAANPSLRILRVKDGGLLDEDSLALLSAMATEHDYQVWMETAGTHRPGIVMHDGEVVA